MDKLRKIIKKIDIFGYPVNLNFNKKSNFHNTILGGIFSILLFVFMIAYFTYGQFKI